MKYVLKIILLLLGVATCKASIIDEVISLAKKHSYKSDSINWEQAKQTITQRCANKEVNTQCVLNNLLTVINDQHSFIATSSKNSSCEIGDSFQPNGWLEQKIAYIEIPSLMCGDPVKQNLYIRTHLKLIAELDSQEPEYWVIDLRGNRGGHMWPMLSVASVFLNTQTAGYAIKNNQKMFGWWAKEGEVGVYQNTHAGQFTAIDIKKPVVVLINKETGSAAEATAISFIGREQTLIAGKQSKGLATMNQPFNLSDGSRLMLATAYFASRNLDTFPDGVTPDISVEINDQKEVINFAKSAWENVFSK
ncbi:S41 family peptidase [Pleionea sediminis]|uniref:S41 family peptidase n=1 Tax=Pleionea sediminis TaxID=2569479 RepID=UPI0013DDCDFE|nr:S41 family peptidase [Pleionea sediminis]